MKSPRVPISVAVMARSEFSGWSPDRARGGSAAENAVTMVFQGSFSSEGALRFLFALLDSTKSNQISEGSGQPLLLHRRKMKDFSYRFIKCYILMP